MSARILVILSIVFGIWLAMFLHAAIEAWWRERRPDPEAVGLKSSLEPDANASPNYYPNSSQEWRRLVSLRDTLVEAEYLSLEIGEDTSLNLLNDHRVDLLRLAKDVDRFIRLRVDPLIWIRGPLDEPARE